MTDFVTWGGLATVSGAIAFTALVTQFIKGIGFIDRIPTRFVSYIVALAILLAAYGFTDVRGIGNYVLCLFNALVVALGSNGTYDAIQSFTKNKNEDTTE